MELEATSDAERAGSIESLSNSRGCGEVKGRSDRIPLFAIRGYLKHGTLVRPRIIALGAIALIKRRSHNCWATTVT